MEGVVTDVAKLNMLYLNFDYFPDDECLEILIPGDWCDEKLTS